jgi:hypothetical protein
MEKKRWVILAIVSLLALSAVFWQWCAWRADWRSFSLNFQPSRPAKNEPQVVKGLYLTAYSAGSDKKITEIIQLLNRTELNAVVIDIKDSTGTVLYDSQLKLVNNLKLKDNRLGDLRKLIDQLHQNKIYVIARQAVFQDPALAEAKPDWAIKNQAGGLWRDSKGLAWVDMTNKNIWRYNLSITREAMDLGFDEINFDYIRFPSDGNLKNLVYTNGDRPRYEVMRGFYHFMSQGLVDKPARISADLFGLVMEQVGENDLGIGQRLADTVEAFDYICPMMYPSHYYPGHLGFTNPADHPAEVIDHGMLLGLPYFQNSRAQLRPWLQAFDLGAIYDANKIRAQIDAVEKRSGAGWLLWNATNQYTDAGLKKE